MDSVEQQPHIQLSRDEVRPVVVVVGDPARVMEIAELCEESRALHHNREYRSMDCKYKGQWFTAVSHGVGAAGAAICFSELCKLGVNAIIRAGSAGSLQPDKLRQGDIVIVQSCAREDGVTNLLVPHGFPAVTDFDVYNSLSSAAKQQVQIERQTTATTSTNKKDGDEGTAAAASSSLEPRIFPGTALTSDLFYASSVMPSTLQTWSKAKIDVVEMEISALFIITKLSNVRSGAMCVVDGCPLGGNHSENYGATSDRTKRGKKTMLKIAIQTASNLTSELLKENKTK